MISLSSSITDQTFSASEVERELNPLGFKLADNWDYDHGYFDYKMGVQDGYQFLRIPFSVESGTMDGPHDQSLIRIKEPFILSHVYQGGIDDHVKEGNIRAMVNQFQEPEDKDADVPEEFIKTGQEVINQVEQALLSKR